MHRARNEWDGGGGGQKYSCPFLAFEKREENLHSNLPGAFILAARNPSLLFLPKAKPSGPRTVRVVVGGGVVGGEQIVRA